MLQNAYFLAKIGADTAENEQHFAVGAGAAVDARGALGPGPRRPPRDRRPPPRGPVRRLRGARGPRPYTIFYAENIFFRTFVNLCQLRQILEASFSAVSKLSFAKIILEHFSEATRFPHFCTSAEEVYRCSISQRMIVAQTRTTYACLGGIDGYAFGNA